MSISNFDKTAHRNIVGAVILSFVTDSHQQLLSRPSHEMTAISLGGSKI